MITQINHAIGASGVVSQECKMVVSQYGKSILEMLLAEVKPFEVLFNQSFVLFLLNVPQGVYYMFSLQFCRHNRKKSVLKWASVHLMGLVVLGQFACFSPPSGKQQYEKIVTFLF